MTESREPVAGAADRSAKPLSPAPVAGGGFSPVLRAALESLEAMFELDATDPRNLVIVRDALEVALRIRDAREGRLFLASLVDCIRITRTPKGSLRFGRIVDYRHFWKLLGL